MKRQVFDIVAVNVSTFLPDFDETPKSNRALNLRLLKQTIESSPEDLQLILSEVLNLPRQKQEELAELLRETSLTAIVSASKTVADRLRFLAGLEQLLFTPELKATTKERTKASPDTC